MNPFLALALGILFGIITQAVVTRLRYDTEWSTIKPGRFWAMVMTGGIAAMAAGLMSLDHPRPIATTPFVYRMWLWQIIAAWMGGVFMDVLSAGVLKSFRAKLGLDETASQIRDQAAYVQPPAEKPEPSDPRGLDTKEDTGAKGDTP